jgi:hypothetical protein
MATEKAFCFAFAVHAYQGLIVTVVSDGLTEGTCGACVAFAASARSWFKYWIKDSVTLMETVVDATCCSAMPLLNRVKRAMTRIVKTILNVMLAGRIDSWLYTAYFTSI